MKTYDRSKPMADLKASATWTGISSITLSFCLLVGSIVIWPLAAVVVIFLTLISCGVLGYGGAIVWYAILICSALQSLLNVNGMVAAIVGTFAAFRSDYRWIMPLKGLGCLFGHGGILALGGWAGWRTYHMMVDLGWDVWRPFG